MDGEYLDIYFAGCMPKGYVQAVLKDRFVTFHQNKFYGSISINPLTEEEPFPAPDVKQCACSLS